MTDDIEELEKQIKIQKLKNELMTHKDGTFEHFLFGLFKIIDNPLLLLLCILSLLVGIWVGETRT